MNEIIISHEKFSSENKNIIGTSIFIMDRSGKKIISKFSLLPADVKERMKAFIAGNFYYLVIRFVLGIIRRILQTHNIMIILFLDARFLRPRLALDIRVSSFSVNTM